LLETTGSVNDLRLVLKSNALACESRFSFTSILRQFWCRIPRMNHFDQASRYAAQADPDCLVQRVLAPTGVSLHYREWLDTRTVTLPGGPNRIADLVAATDDPSAFPVALLYEFQSQHDAEKLEVSLLEAIAHRLQLRHGKKKHGKYRVLPVLVYLSGRCPVRAVEMTLGSYGIEYKPLIWDVADDDASATLEAVASGTMSWGMLFWISLMKGAKNPAVVARWRELVTQMVANARRKASLSIVAHQFAELAGRALVWKRGLEGLSVVESTLAKELIAQGELRKQRNNLLLALKTRFKKEVSTEVAQLINEQESMELLEEWFLAALRAKTYNAFFAVLKK